MEILPALLGALPDLGITGVVLVVILFGKRIIDSERTHFTTERATLLTESAAARSTLRTEAAEERAELRAEVRELKTENRELWEQRRAEAPTGSFPAVRPYRTPG